MFESSEWEISGTGLVIKDCYTKTEAENLCNKLNFTMDSINFANGTLSVFAGDVKKVFFLEEYYISHEPKFSNVLERLSVKDFNLDFQYFSVQTESLIDIGSIYNFEEEKIYKKLVENNILSHDGIRQDYLYLSPYIFEKLLESIKKYEEKEYHTQFIDVLTYMRELFSLLAISEKTTYRNNKGEQSFTFQFFHDSKGVISKEFYWGEWDSLSSTNYFSLYKWIRQNVEKNSNEDNYNRNLKLVKLIVQDYIRNINKIEVNKDTTNELDSILSRVRNNQTKTYFEQQNKLKDEIIGLSHDEMQSKKRIQNHLLGILTTTSVGFYSQFFNDNLNIQSIESLKGPNFALSLVFLFSTIAIAFIMISLFNEIKERINHYEKIRNIYTDYLFFDREDFESKVSKPRVWSDYKFYWIVLILVLIISVFLMVYYGHIPIADS